MMMDRKEKDRKVMDGKIAALLLTLLLAGLLQVHTLAEPVIAKACAYSGCPLVWFVKGLEGDLLMDGQSVTGVAAAVGDVPCEAVEACSMPNSDEIHFKTVIMLDNSASISAANRQKALDLIQRLIRDHAEGEEFVIYTFSKELTEVAAGKDYEGLAQAAAGIEFHDQDAYLTDCLVNVLDSLGEEQTLHYNRVILICDGVDDNKAGNTLFDLADRLADDTTRCPVYTVVSVWEKDTSGVKNLQKISEIAGGRPFVLDETEDLSRITSVIAEDYNAKMFTIYLPLEEKDGQKKTVLLSVATTAGLTDLEHEVRVPGRTQEEEDQLQARKESEAEKELDDLAGTLEVDPLEDETQEVPEPEAEPSFFKQYRFMIIGGAAVLTALIIAVVILLLRKKKNDRWDDNGWPQYPDDLTHLEEYGSTVADDMLWTGGSRKKNNAGKAGGFDYERTARVPGNTSSGSAGGLGHELTQDEVAGVDPDAKEKTIGMWESDADLSCGKMILLTDVHDPKRHYEVRLRDALMIGRDSRCKVVLSDDRTVSGNHCRLILLSESVLAEDQHSHNGTSINGERIAGAVPLRSGDELKLGATRLRVEIQ